MGIALGLVPQPDRAIRDAGQGLDDDQVTTGRPRPMPPTRLSGPVRRLTAGSGDPLGGEAVPVAIETILRRRAGTGALLPDSLAQELGSGFGADLSGVRVHTDPEAARISRQLQAMAFTRGQDIYFSTGAYRPESAPGRHLIAHELAHVVQQRGSTGAGPGAVIGPGSIVGRADDPAERQADELAARVTRNRPAPANQAPAAHRPAGQPPVQRYVVTDLKPKDRKASAALRARYVKLNDDDEAHYGPIFDAEADLATTVAEMEKFVVAAEAEKAQRKTVVPAASVSAPGPSQPAAAPAASSSSGSAYPTSTPGTGPSKKVKPTVTSFALGPAAYVPVAETVIDRYAGLSAKVRALAVQITAWPTNTMDGTSAALSASEQAELRVWVENQQTPSGLQKYVVNIGPGTGTYSGTQQFKVTGFGNVGGKAPTFHITL